MSELFIKNKEELIKKLFLYRSNIYRKTEFKTDIDDKQIIAIIEALNIKKRRKRLEYIYDYCCKTVDKFNDGKNICGFQQNKCIMQQTPECNFTDGCCRLCIHQHGKGCETSNLSCKFFYCDAVTNNHKVLRYKDFPILKILTLRQRLMVKDNFFSTREEILNDIYIGSIIIFGFRLTYRIFRDFFLFIIKKNNYKI